MNVVVFVKYSGYFERGTHKIVHMQEAATNTSAIKHADMKQIRRDTFITDRNVTHKNALFC